MADIAAIQAAITEAATLGLTRRQFARSMIDVLLASMASAQVKAAGVVSYTVNGRSVTRSVSQAREELAVWQGYASGGGMVIQGAEFAS